jgi:DNA repair protein SbcD/Mre11
MKNLFFLCSETNRITRIIITMFKFIHAADIHLDSPMRKLDYYEGAPVGEFRQATRRAFENLIQLAVSENVAFVLIAGDLYDGDWKDYNTGLYFVAQMARLRDAGIPVFIVTGNHDAASNITKTLRFPENVKIFPSDSPATFQIENRRVAIHGQSFASPAVKKDLASCYPMPVNGCYNIGLLHTCVSGREGHEPYAPCSLEDLKNKGYDYWALGHVHKHEVIEKHPPIVFSGNTQGRHRREAGSKGCVLVTVGKSHETEIEFTPIDVVRWVIAEVDATGAESGYDILDRTRKLLEELLEENDGMPLAARLQIKGKTFAHEEFFSDLERWINEIRSVALDACNGKIWVEKIKTGTRLPDSGQLLEQKNGAIGELLRLFDELSAETTLHPDLTTELADLERKLPLELKTMAEGFKFNDVEWMKDTLEQVKPMLVKRLLKKGAVE